MADTPPTAEHEDDDPKGRIVQELISRAGNLDTQQGVSAVKEIAREAWATELDSADRLELIDALHESTGLTKKRIEAYFDDAQLYHEEHGTLSSPKAVARAVVKELAGEEGELIFSNGKFHQYVSGDDAAAGTFVSETDDEFDDLLLRQFPLPAVASSAKRREIRRQTALLVREDDAFREAACGLCLGNGTLLVDQNTGLADLVPHSPAFRMRNKLDVDYDPHASCERFSELLARVMGDVDDAVNAFLVFFACVVLRVRLRNDMVRTVLLLFGPPRTGKSTLLELVQRFVSKRLVTFIEPARMGKPENIADLAHSQLNVQTELSKTRKLKADAIKKITSGEPVEGRRMRQDPFSFTSDTSNMWATNLLPIFDEPDRSLLRRLILIKMGKTLTDQEAETDFWAVVEAEKAGIINLLIEKYAAACVTGRFPLPANQEELGAELLLGSDLVARFIRLHVEARPGARLWSRDLQPALLAYLREQGSDEPVHNGHMKRAAALLESEYGARRTNSGGCPWYSGVALKGSEPAANPPVNVPLEDFA